MNNGVPNLADGREVLGCAAGGVVPTVGEAGEDLGVPGRADHHVRQLQGIQPQRVTELVHAPEP